MISLCEVTKIVRHHDLRENAMTELRQQMRRDDANGSMILPRNVALGGNNGEWECGEARRFSACARLGSFVSQKRVHRNYAAGKVTQALSEAQGRFFSTSEEIAQMRVRALSRLGKLFNRFAVGFSPAEHWMQVRHSINYFHQK